MEQPLLPASRAPVSPAPRSQRPWLIRHRWPLLLVAGWLFQAAFRAWLGRAQGVPLANPDESAYLISARVLAGGPGANFSYSTLYPAGYPLLITPVFWFTQNPLVAYHAVVIVNALASALLMPLGYVASKRLGLTSRPLAYGAAMVTALLPAGMFYSVFALSDAIFPVIVLAWLLVTHSWLTRSWLTHNWRTGGTARGRYLCAAGSALLAGYAYAVHSRGLVMIAGYLVLLAILALRSLFFASAAPAPATARTSTPASTPASTRASILASVALAGTVLVVCAGISLALNRLLRHAIYPRGARSLAAAASARLGSPHGIILVLEMAVGQMWRFVLDSWGVAALGLVAVVVTILSRRTRADIRIIAGLALAVTLAIAVTTPAALPADQPRQWASGRYLDAMIVAFFLPGLVVLLRAGHRRKLIYAACVLPPAIVAALVVRHYVGSSVPTLGFGAAFNFAEPAVLTQNWTSASVALATVVALGLLAVWVAIAALPSGPRVPILLAALATASVLADVQMVANVGTANQRLGRAIAVDPVSGLRHGQRIGISKALGWQLWVPQAYQMSWRGQVFFKAAKQPPPAGVTVVEVPWPRGQSVAATWPTAPHGWHISEASRLGGWALWAGPENSDPKG